MVTNLVNCYPKKDLSVEAVHPTTLVMTSTYYGLNQGIQVRSDYSMNPELKFSSLFFKPSSLSVVKLPKDSGIDVSPLGLRSRVVHSRRRFFSRDKSSSGMLLRSAQSQSSCIQTSLLSSDLSESIFLVSAINLVVLRRATSADWRTIRLFLLSAMMFLELCSTYSVMYYPLH